MFLSWERARFPPPLPFLKLLHYSLSLSQVMSICVLSGLWLGFFPLALSLASQLILAASELALVGSAQCLRSYLDVLVSLDSAWWVTSSAISPEGFNIWIMTVPGELWSQRWLFFLSLSGIAPHCLDEGTVRSITVEAINGKEWEKAVKAHPTIQSMSKP